MQHKRELGNKYVTGVRILRNDAQAEGEDQHADLVFDIADVPIEEQSPDVPMQDPPQGKIQSDAPITSTFNNLTIREAPECTAKEQILGPRNILRTHTVIVHRST